jgi:hypothetical protein
MGSMCVWLFLYKLGSSLKRAFDGVRVLKVRLYVSCSINIFWNLVEYCSHVI